MTSSTPTERAEALLGNLTTEERVALVAGASFWTTVPVERLGVPAMKVTDGPNGARGDSFAGGVPAAAFPVGIALGATWDPALIERIGRALGEEARSKGAHMLLAPTVNIHRSPLNGRTFECYSEDPLLSARATVAYITGVQSTGIGAVVKHFVCNDSEFERNSISSEVAERPLREIYLPPFAVAVREAGVWAVMSAYNKLNGTFCSEHHTLLTELLRGEWGFDGLVMSDWLGTYSTAPALAAGLDLEMPGPPRWRGEQLLAAVWADETLLAPLEDSARRVLRTLARVGAFERPADTTERAEDRPEHQALIREAGAAGIVLLKNEGMTLPLDPSTLTSIAVIGPNARTAQIMGGGSAQINAHYAVSPFDGIAAAVGEQVELGYALGCTNHNMLPSLPQSLVGEGFATRYFPNLELDGSPLHEELRPSVDAFWMAPPAPGVDPAAFSASMSATLTPRASGWHAFSLASAGLSRLFLDDRLVVDNWSNQKPGGSFFGLGSGEIIGAIELEADHSYALRVEYSRQNRTPLAALRLGFLPPLPGDAIAQAAELAARSDVALVFVGTNSDWESEGFDRAGLGLPGEQDALVEAVATANPRTMVVLQTGGPVVMPWLEQVAAVVQAWFPGQECGNAISDVLLGRVCPSGKLPTTFPRRLEDNPAFLNYPGENGRVRYGEGIFVGYRAYEKQQIAPLFPFGFGLSYTTFAYTNLRLSVEALRPDERLTVQVDVTNTGRVAGAEVVQLYIRDVAARLARPEKELKGFAKVQLAPGETQTVSLEIGREALAYWDDRRHAWVAEAGAFEALVGASSADIRERAGFELSETAVFGEGVALGH